MKKLASPRPIRQELLQKTDVLIMPHPSLKELKVGDAAKLGADLAITQIFRQDKNAKSGVHAYYDPKTETIGAHAGEFLDVNEKKKPAKVERVLLLGSNYPMFGAPRNTTHIAYGEGSILQAPLSETIIGDNMAAPEDSELTAFASTLHAKKVLDKNGIPATILYLPSDLPPHRIDGILDIRDDYKDHKLVHPHMQRMLEAYDYAELPRVSNRDLRKEKETLNEDQGWPMRDSIRSGQAIWYALESEYRSKASKILDTLVKPSGIEMLVEQMHPGGRTQWEAENRDKKDSWKLVTKDSVYYIDFTRTTRKGKQTLRIPIGVEMENRDGKMTSGAPKCALITSALLKRAESDFGFTHLIAAFHSYEISIASAGFFIARRILGVKMHPHAVQFNRDTNEPEEVGRDGKHAFMNQLRDPLFRWDAVED